MFQNIAKHLVDYRQRDLNHIFQRLAILSGLRHQCQTLEAAVEKSRNGARIANSLEFTLLLSARSVR
jgi:Holliday junction resolvasome RuvABC ATP-dependent DNA helicase subunit